MIIIDERKITNKTFGELNHGAVFVHPFYDEDIVFMKMGIDINDVITDEIDPERGWLAVNLKDGEFSFFANDTEVTEVRANLTIK